MKLYSWNVNGIRSVSQKGFLEWLKDSNADVCAVQEIKATPDQLDLFLLNPHGYHSYWAPAKKPGYSGVAIYSKKEPLDIKIGIGISEFDDEGRIITADYGDFVLINTYFPNSQREHERLPYKLSFCDSILKFCNSYVSKGKNIVLCGDYNIAHQEIDLKNPKSNMNNAGFLPEERAWMTHFLSKGYVDAFRHFEKGPGHYTWWSYRPGVRQKNIGWRLDYHTVNQSFIDRVKSATLLPQVKGSDHCPIELVIK